MEENSMRRRSILRQMGTSGAAIGTIAVAGCTSGVSNQQGNEPINVRIPTAETTESNNWESVAPSPTWEIAKRLEENSDGNIESNVIGASQSCGEEQCMEKLANGTIDIGVSSISNATKVWKENNVWVLPFLFPDHYSRYYTIFKEETWENFWIPFGKEFGVVPFAPSLVHQRGIHLHTDNQLSKNPTPEEIKGAKVRTTQNDIFTKIFDRWGLNPIAITFAETLQGIESGTVDGLEIGALYSCGFGFLDLMSHTLLLNFGGAIEMVWARVEWLKNLSESNRSIIAETTKTTSEDYISILDDRYSQLGWSDNPAEENCHEKQNVTPAFYEDEEAYSKWVDPVDPQNNRELYKKDIDPREIGTWDFYDYLWETARSDDVPNTTENWEIDSWWDDHIDNI